MFDFCFGGWTHAEAGWSHKSAGSKERYYVPTCARRPDSNICMLATLMQPYFFDVREILFSASGALGPFIHRQTVGPIPFEG
jgi:hypothetical protein